MAFCHHLSPNSLYIRGEVERNLEEEVEAPTAASDVGKKWKNRKRKRKKKK